MGIDHPKPPQPRGTPMDGFKQNPKMQCFKEGGQVKYETRKEHKEEVAADINQDKQIIKKAFKMHDSQEHKGEHTDLSKLKKGGRAKKDCGTVKKYKAGGSVTNVYEAKKKSGDISNIQKTKEIKPAKAAAPSKGSERPAFAGSDVAKTNKMPSGSSKVKKVSEDAKTAATPSGAKGGPNKYKKGGMVKKMADGGMTGQGAVSDVERRLMALDQQRAMEKMKRAMTLGPAMQSQLINQSPAAAGISTPAAAPTAPVGQPGMQNIARKRGGKVC